MWGAQVVSRQKSAALLVLELRIETVRTGVAGVARQLVQLALAGALHPAAGQDVAGDHGFGIAIGARGVMGGCYRAT